MAESPYALLDRAGAASIFFPRSDQRPPPAGARDLSIEVDAGIDVAARFYVQDAANPTVLYFHGNGEVAADHDDIAPFYHAIGLNLFVAEFRGYGQSNGQPSYEALVEDAHPVVDFFQATYGSGHQNDVRTFFGILHRNFGLGFFKSHSLKF